MAQALYASVPTSHGTWAVVLLSDSGKSRQTLPALFETEDEARRYANMYLRLYS